MRKPIISEADRRLHALLMAIEVHGPSVVMEGSNPSVVQWVRANYQQGFRQLVQAMREARMSRDDVRDMLRPGGPHPRACACWDCVSRTHMEAVRYWAQRRASEEENW